MPWFSLFLHLVLIICSVLLPVSSKVLMLLMDEDPVCSMKTRMAHIRRDEEVRIYKDGLVRGHDMFLQSILPSNSYTKLYSYTHLINGIAVHVNDQQGAHEILENAEGVRLVQEDMKMQKLTTYTPDFLGIPSGVWPGIAGGAQAAGEGVVIGLIDTGIDPQHPSFAQQSINSTYDNNPIKDYQLEMDIMDGSNSSGGNKSSNGRFTKSRFNGTCEVGESFPASSCNGKIAGAHYFARAAIAAGDFNVTRDIASPFDADGHGSHTASTAAGNYRVPVVVHGYTYGYASGMAPGARIAVYKALYSFGGYMADVVAAVDQAVEDGVDVLSLSIGPSSVPPGPASFLNMLEIELLFASRAGVLVIQAAGNGGPSPTSVLSFSPWITTVGAYITDRRYNNSVELGNGHSFAGTGLTPPTPDRTMYPLAAAADVSVRNMSSAAVENCQNPELFILPLVRGKVIICTYNFEFEFESANVASIADTIQRVGANGFILTMDPSDSSNQPVRGTSITLPVPGVLLTNPEASVALWDYYNSGTMRNRNGLVLQFGATARINDGREAVYLGGQAPVVASYSSRGPDVNNALLQTADVLKPNLVAPGSLIWAAWSPNSEGDRYIKGQQFALVSGTSMATPHVAGVAAMIKQKYPKWSPAEITSAMMTTANTTDHSGLSGLLAQKNSNQMATATPFDYGAGAINPAKALDPGLVFKADFKKYIKFLCAVPGVDDDSVMRAVGVGCPNGKKAWCSDLNMPSITVSNLVGMRKVVRKVTDVTGRNETYHVRVREPEGVGVTVEPLVFAIGGNQTQVLRILLEAKQASNTYSFGEMVLEGDGMHLVRIPLAVSVTSVLGHD